MNTANTMGGRRRRSSRKAGLNVNYYLMLLVAFNGVIVCLIATLKAVYETKMDGPHRAMLDFRSNHFINEVGNDSVGNSLIIGASELNETPGPKEATIADFEPVDFIPEKNIFEKQDAYAGGWWQTTERFFKMPLDEIDDRISPSFFAFTDNRMNELRMTNDWLEFSVEHLSKWWKITEWQENLGAYTFLMNKLTNYVHRNVKAAKEHKEDPKATERTSEMQQTLAVIAFSPYEVDNQRIRSQVLTAINLAATMSSLHRVRMGRIVVACDTIDIKATVAIFHAARKLLSSRNATRQSLEIFLKDFEFDNEIKYSDDFALEFELGGITEIALVAVPCIESRGTYLELEPQVPKAALLGLRQALLGYGPEPYKFRRKWLGHRVSRTKSTSEDMSLWEYIYLTEPDTLLHAKSAALPALAQALREGNVVVPHRIQPLPHESDLPTMPKHLVVPALGNASSVLDIAWGDRCCDVNLHPAWEYSICNGHTWNLWYWCGFAKALGEEVENPQTDREAIHAAHFRLESYGFLRLRSGSGIANLAASNNARLCVVRKRDLGKCPLMPNKREEQVKEEKKVE